MSSSFKKGVTFLKKGCRFVVWAPHADEVYIIGSFNDWNKTSHPMKAKAGGIWWLDVPEVKRGDEYRYRIIHQGREFLRIDPYARNVTSSIGNAIVCELTPLESDGFKMPPLHEMVIYELHIGTFGKSRKDDAPRTIQGAIERLSYLKELGINAVEVMPVAEFPGGYSWGYNPAHIFAVESDYGEPHVFREFVRQAHRLGIAVIVDVVYNHLGPDDLDLWQFDGWHENEKGGIYFYNDWRAETPWGETRPDYGREEVREYIRDNALMWFREFSVDGLRWDSTLYIRNVHGENNNPKTDLPEGWSLMQWVNEEIKKHYPHALTIAEDLQGNPYLTKDQKDGGAGFDSQWNAAFVHSVREALIAAEDSDRNMETVKNAVSHRYHLDAFERVIYTESHDEVANGKARVPEEVDPGRASSWVAKKKSALGATLVFTAPGVPMIFQGQEFLEDDWFHDQDPIDWTKRERFAGIWQLYHDLIHLRLNRDNNTPGLCGHEIDVYHVNDEENVIAYRRWEENGDRDSVVIVANFSSTTKEDYLIGFPFKGEWIIRFNSDSKQYDKEFGNVSGHRVDAAEGERDGMPAQGKVSIAPYSALILTPS